MLSEYKKDDAGLRLLETFEHLKHSTHYADPLLSWHDCHVWLGLALESEHFTPTSAHSPVQLMTLEQAAYLNFDCIIIAATESQHFPGGPVSSPFFNQAVRASLELSTWEQQNKLRQNTFQADSTLCTNNSINGLWRRKWRGKTRFPLVRIIN